MNDFQKQIWDAIEQGMSIKFVVAKFGISFDLAEQMFEQRHNEELCKQHEFLSYADECANDDAQYYGG